MAQPSFILQGVRKGNDHESALKRLLTMDNLSHAILSVAFVRESGVSVIAEQLSAKAKNMSVLVGIRNGSTSAQGLIALLSCKIKLFVVDTGATSPIFHPKIYLGANKATALAIIGSANLTNAGLNRNIEGSTILVLNREEPKDEEFYQDILAAFSSLQHDYPEHVLQITRKRQISELLDQGRIEDERYTPPPRLMRLRNQATRDKLKRIKLITKQHPVTITKKQRKEKKGTKQYPGLYELVWISKGLTERDLNIPSGKNTNATGSMLWKKGASGDIDQRIYFRDDVFANLKWVKESKKGYEHLERTLTKFEISIKGINYGSFSLKMTHNTRKDSSAFKQNNAMTQIHWGAVKDIIAQKDLLGREMRLYRKIDDKTTFIIDID